MRKRGATHVEMVIAFVLFIGAMFVIFFMFKPLHAFQPKLHSEVVLLQTLNDKLKTELRITTLYIRSAAVYDLAIGNVPAADKAKILIENVPGGFQVGTGTIAIITGQANLAKLSATPPDRIEIDWEGNEENSRVTLINGPTGIVIPTVGDPEGTDALSDPSLYYLSSFDTWEGIAYKTARDFFSKPLADIRSDLGVSSPSAGVKIYLDVFGPPAISDLEAGDSTPDNDLSIQVYSYSRTVPVYHDGKFYTGRLMVKTW